MATWKRLTRATETADRIDVNMDALACMQRYADHTVISFAVLEGERLAFHSARQLTAQQARTAGLLGQDQSVTHAKTFKRAKQSLGIKSVRAGFGARSQWRWQLPRQSEACIKTDSRPPRESRTARRSAIPIDWLQGVARLNSDRPPDDVPRHRWRQYVMDCEHFVNSSWAERAYQLGWDAMGLFGYPPKGALNYSGSAGLLWAMNGARLVQLYQNWAVLEVPVNRSERIFHRRNVDPAKISLPWRW